MAVTCAAKFAMRLYILGKGRRDQHISAPNIDFLALGNVFIGPLWLLGWMACLGSGMETTEFVGSRENAEDSGK